jgi:hypothetical protein
VPLYIVTFETERLHSISEPDKEAQLSILHEYRTLFLRPQGDGTVKGNYELDADDEESAWAETQTAVIRALGAAGRQVNIESFVSHRVREIVGN